MEGGDGRHLAAGLLQETGRQELGLVPRAGGRSLWAAFRSGCGSPSSSSQVLSGKRRPRSLTDSPRLRQFLASESTAFPRVRPDALQRLTIPSLTPQAAVLSPERVQLSPRDKNHVSGVCGHVNSSPSRGLFISESTHRASPDLSAIFGPVARKPKPTKPGAQGEPAASAADRPSVAAWETLRLHPLPPTREVLRVRIYLHLAPAAEIERCWRGGVVIRRPSPDLGACVPRDLNPHVSEGGSTPYPHIALYAPAPRLICSAPEIPA